MFTPFAFVHFLWGMSFAEFSFDFGLGLHSFYEIKDLVMSTKPVTSASTNSFENSIGDTIAFISGYWFGQNRDTTKALFAWVFFATWMRVLSLG